MSFVGCLFLSQIGSSSLQRAMDSILNGIPFVICYLDDILVSGRTDDEHLKNLEEVLRRLQFHGLRLKKDKCGFLQKSVEYVGH